MMTCALTAATESAPVADSPFHDHRRRFERNVGRPLPALPPTATLPATDLRPALAAILARFQLGEAGGGSVARQIDRLELPGVDDDYRQSLKLFVKEEGRHARILALLVRQLGGGLLSRQGSDALFCRCRRLLGLRFKIVVLLVAEVVGAAVYGVLSRRWGGDRGVAALAEIAEDERHHLRFHAHFLTIQSGGVLQRTALRLGFWLVAAGALAIVLFENARDLRRLSLRPTSLASRVMAGLWRADGLAFGCGQVQP